MSIRRRLLFSSLLLLSAFLGVAGVILDNAFRDAGRQGVEDLLRVQILAILGAADAAAGPTIELPAELSEPRLQNPGSGLYAEIVDPDGNTVWRSSSLLGSLDFGGWLDRGEVYSTELSGPGNQDLLALSMGIEWVFDDGSTRNFRVSVAQNLAAYHAQVSGFRRKLLTWFAGLGVFLLFAQLWILRQGLAPLRRIEGCGTTSRKRATQCY